MSNFIRVLIVEDSPTTRALLGAILRGDPHIRVVGEAVDGLEGVELAQKLRPDVVTMDIHMPRMDGFAATKEIMITAPTPIVIATGSTVAAEVNTAMSALRAGAVAVVRKPRGPEAANFAEMSEQLLSTVKAMAQVKVVRHWRPSASPALLLGSRSQSPARAGAVRVVAIAASTGGPPALQQVLSALPGDFPVPILVVQHIATGFTPSLAIWLDNSCDVRVKIAEQGEPLAPHRVYLAPDDHHLGVTARNTIALTTDPHIGGFRPSGTYLFMSVAQAFGAATVAVILTGMGEDGVAGLRQVRLAGGRTIAQDEASSIVFGMPGAAVAAGLAQDILPLDGIAARLVQLIGVR